MNCRVQQLARLGTQTVLNTSMGTARFLVSSLCPGGAQTAGSSSWLGKRQSQTQKSPRSLWSGWDRGRHPKLGLEGVKGLREG